MNPPNDKKSPPTGLLWGAGEPQAPKRQPANSPDVKGLFTESVIAQLPEADAEISLEDDAVAKLFPKPTVMSQPPPVPKSHWHEPGTPPRAPEPHVKVNEPAAISAAIGAQAAPRMPAGAIGAATRPERAVVAKVKVAQGTFGAAVTQAAERTIAKRAASAPLAPPAPAASQPLDADHVARSPAAAAMRQANGAVDGSTAQPSAEALKRRPVSAPLNLGISEQPSAPLSDLAVTVKPPGQPARREAGLIAANVRPAARAFEPEEVPTARVSMPAPPETPSPAAGAAKSDLATTAPPGPASAPVAANDNAPRRGPSGPLTVQNEIPGRPANKPRAVDARISRTPLQLDVPSPRSELELETEPAAARAADLARQNRAQSLPSPSEATPQRAPAPATDGADAPASYSSVPPSERPRGKDKRSEARRAARRKAAKQLPPPPAATPKAHWDAARITLVAFLSVAAAFAAALGAAAVGWLPLPPAAAAMLGIEAQASLSRIEPNKSSPVPKPQAAQPAPAAAPQPQAQATDTAPTAPTAPTPSATPQAAEPTPQPQAAEPTPQPEAERVPTTMPAKDAAPRPHPTAPPGIVLSEPAPEPTPAPSEPAAAPQPSAAAPATQAAAPQPPATAPATQATEPATASASALAAAGRARLRAGDAPGAAELLQKAVAADPDDHHAAEALVQAWIVMKRGQDALPYVEQIVKKRPKRAAYRILEGDARRLIGDEAGAIAAYRAALALEPDNREAKAKLGAQ